MNFAKIISKREGHGKSTADVLCSCGFVNRVFLWSWAGHSKFICRRCLARVSYRTLEITPKEPKP